MLSWSPRRGVIGEKAGRAGGGGGRGTGRRRGAFSFNHAGLSPVLHCTVVRVKGAVEWCHWQGGDTGNTIYSRR